MDSCLLCLEINENSMETIKTNSTQWLEYHVAELIEKHFWPVESLLNAIASGLCLPCWQELNTFHKFYKRIEEAHINFGRLIKVGDKTQLLETVNSNKDDREYITYGLLEPEILLGKQNKEEVETISTIKTEPQDESFFNRDPLEKPVYSKSVPLKSKRKITRLNSNTINRVSKEEKREIKKEIHNSESEDDNDNDGFKQNQSDSDNNTHNKDNQTDSENKKQKTYYKHRTNRKEIDQFIVKHFKEIVCDLCKSNFNSFSSLREHFNAVHKQKSYIFCCNKKFFNRTLLVDHIHSHFNPDHFKCNECGRVMSDRLRLESHMLRFHGVTELEKKMKHCDVCQKPFIDSYSLRNHKLTHLPEEDKKFPCTECGKFYASSKLLKSHKEAVHLKKFVKICYICGKSIASSSDYKLHMNKHEGIPAPDISCDVCGLRLASERGLKRHKESQHPVGGKKEHPCPICPKVSPTLKALKKHVSTMHEKRYDHKCTICEKAFKRSDALKEHMASHTGTALYTCPWCPKTFNSNGNMHAHRKRVHPKEWKEEKLKKYSSILPQQSSN